jgi:hypothetical protein
MIDETRMIEENKKCIINIDSGCDFNILIANPGIWKHLTTGENNKKINFKIEMLEGFIEYISAQNKKITMLYNKGSAVLKFKPSNKIISYQLTVNTK